MIQNVTAIVIAVGVVIGLVPLGARSVSDLIRSHRRRKTNEMLTTVLVSVLASHLAPPVLTELAQRLGAVAEVLPPWAKAALGAFPQEQAAGEAEQPAGSKAEQPMNGFSKDGHAPSATSL
jgi:hypothetical protein